MRRFVRLVLVVAVSLLTLTVCVLFVGRTSSQHNMIESLGFGLCADKPCFLGIAPSETKWTEITPELLNQKIIQSVSQAGPQNMSFFANGLGIALTGQYDRPDISMIKISIYKNQPVQLGDFVRFYGRPCAEASSTNGQLELLYPYMTVMLNTRPNQLDLNANIIRVTLLDANSQYPGIKDWCELVKQYGTKSGFQLIEPYEWLRWN